MHRRSLLRWLVSGAMAWPLRGVEIHAQAANLSSASVATLRAVAPVVLPSELGAAGHDKVVSDFVQWLASYHGGAERGWGYGHPRPGVTPAIDPRKYDAQLTALGSLAGRSLDQRRTALSDALNASGVRALPGSPNGTHVVTDFMGFFFASAAANDLVYRARISRSSCRGLAGAPARPSATAGD
jgi:hypothetical protein